MGLEGTWKRENPYRKGVSGIGREQPGPCHPDPSTGSGEGRGFDSRWRYQKLVMRCRECSESVRCRRRWRVERRFDEIDVMCEQRECRNLILERPNRAETAPSVKRANS